MLFRSLSSPGPGSLRLPHLDYSLTGKNLDPKNPGKRKIPFVTDLGERTMPVIFQTSILLVFSNLFMTFARYAHLKHLNDQKWWITALVSWGIALFEYMLQIPANRIRYTQLNLSQLKIVQEVITLSVFVPFAIFYMHQPIKLDYLWAGASLLGAVYFIFRA